MIRTFSLKVVSVVSAGVLLVASHANAASVSFALDEFTGADTSATATVDDLGFEMFKFTVENVEDDDGIGDITGIFLDFAPGLLESDFTAFTGASEGGTSSSISVAGFGTDTSNLGGGVNLSGGGPANPGNFDYGLRFEGFNVDDIQTIMFTIDATGLGASLDDFTRVALRLQSVGLTGGSRSDGSKLVSSDIAGVTPVPVPAGILLMLTALGGFGWLGYRRSRAA